MKRKLFNVFLVAVGAAIGSAVTWKVVKDKYERIAQEEIDSVKEEYQNMRDMLYSVEAMTINKKVKETQNDEDDEYEEDEMFQPSEDSVFEYHKIASMYRSSMDGTYNDSEQKGGTGDTDEVPYINGPYVISPDDFRNSPPGYNAQALDYFADGVLCDSWGNQLDIDETIGEDSLNHFGDYVDDLMYVRNERKEIDYEVTCDVRRYDEVYGPDYSTCEMKNM